MDTPTYILFQNTRVFSWTCPKCVADEMPFHDCSVLSSSSSDTSRSDIFQSQCIGLPSLISPAGLRVANLNCCSLLSIADKVFTFLFIKVLTFLLLLKHGWTLPLVTMRFFLLTSSISIVCSDQNLNGGGIAFFLYHEE